MIGLTLHFQLRRLRTEPGKFVGLELGLKYQEISLRICSKNDDPSSTSSSQL